MNRSELKKITSKALSLLGLLLTTTATFSLPEDRYQVAKLWAETVELNQQTHYGEYHGNVQIDQGTAHLRAANAFTKGNGQNKLLFALAKGDQKEQAHYWVMPAAGKPEMHAYADTIRYYPQRHLIELTGNARIIQGNNSFAAPKIRYHTLKQHIISAKDGNNGTTIIISPESLKPEKVTTQKVLPTIPSVPPSVKEADGTGKSPVRKKHE